jgi:hypothetical protein
MAYFPGKKKRDKIRYVILSMLKSYSDFGFLLNLTITLSISLFI